MKITLKRLISVLLAAMLISTAFCQNVFAIQRNTDNTFYRNSFRGNADNNGVVNALTPKSADDAVLYWAKKLGEGFDEAATGCPIFVGDELVLCAKDNILKVNKFTGEVTVSNKMAGSSSFNIIPPLYAEGMIFVGLANGTVQAFDAETLDSLWIYKDTLKGQPNSPITYNNGCIYTGFWNGEIDDANLVCLSVTDEDKSTPNEEKSAEWSYTQKGGFYWAGAYASSKFLLVGTDDGNFGYLGDTSCLLSLNPQNGRVIDKIENLDGDIRSSICYDKDTDRYYFTSKGGSFYGVSVDENGKFLNIKSIKLSNGADNPSAPAMSTCTPVVYNGRAYVGVSGTSQFKMYSGHNITVIDLNNWKIAYSVPTKGYPQASGLLTNGYEDEDGYIYVYFIDNYTPGQIRVLKDKSGVNSVIGGVTESYFERGKIKYVNGCAPVLFTPSGEQAEYSICSPIVDEYGTIYFKNDSAYVMALGSKVLNLEVTSMPDKTEYFEGESFESAGLKVTAHFANGIARDVTDYCKFSDNSQSLSLDDTDVTIYYDYAMYGDSLDDENGNITNISADIPETYVDISVSPASRVLLGDADLNGKIDVEDATAVQKYAAKLTNLTDTQKLNADVDKNNKVDVEDATLIQKYSAGLINNLG